MKVLIVGAGIGGLTLAAFFKKRNISFEIIEKAPNWDNLGFALGLWADAREILGKLGLEKKIQEASASENDYHLLTGKGKTIKRFNFNQFNKGKIPAFTHIHRADLHNMLLEASGNPAIRMDTHLKSIEHAGEQEKVTFSDGTTELYDLVVGADGIKSQVRDLAFRGDFLRYLGWRAYFFWIDKKISLPKGTIEISEAGEFCEIFNEVGSRNLAILATPADHRIWDEAEDRLQRVSARFKTFKWILPEILSGLKAENLLPVDIAYVKMHNWISGHVVLIGDAAHAVEPFAGMGVAMAIEDAYVLGDELAKNGEGNLTECLENYQIRRKKRISIAEKQASRIWRRIHINSKFVFFVRNILAPFVPINYFTSGYKKLLKEEI